MKHYLFFCLYIACSSHAVVAQDSVLKKLSIRVTIYDPDNKETKGWLSQINDSTMEISNKSQHFARTSAKSSYTTIDYSRISAVKLKRNNGAGRGAIIGAITGFVIGAIGGFSAGDDPYVPANQDILGLANVFRMTAVEKAALYGLTGAFVGGGIGAITGHLIIKRFTIGGKKEKFDEMRLSVIEMAYRPKWSKQMQD